MADQPITRDEVLDSLRGFCDPETGRNVVQMEQVSDLVVDKDTIRCRLGLTTHSAPLWEETTADLSQRLKTAFPQARDIRVDRGPHERPPQPIGEIGLTAKTVIAVGSGKGGVGKSTIAVALAAGLQKAGSRVGLMDADVYGPSVPHLLGLSGRPMVLENKIQPIEKDGIAVMSMGFLVPADDAVVWRGPMLHGAITQFLRDTAWGPLDYLIIDMPPGTGDIALTLSQLLPLTGAVVVCTPQDVALADAIKAIAMFRKVNIPILGMVENMSGFVCPECGKRYDIFGHGGAREKAEQLEVPFLGDVPINISVRERGDAGSMTESLHDPALASVLQRLSYQLVSNLARSNRQAPPMPSLPVL